MSILESLSQLTTAQTVPYTGSAVLDVPANQNIISLLDDPFAPQSGFLPNGQMLEWQVLDHAHIPLILHLQDTVNAAAGEMEKNFLIKRTETCYADSLNQGHLYWGAFADGLLIAVFGMADNDEEVGDGRGEKAPKEALGVSFYNQVSILKGAQVHPQYRDQGLAALGALTRYTYFLQNPLKKVIMTKVHAGNTLVCKNYTQNGFVEACRAAVTDSSHTFNVITFKCDRSLLEEWIANKAVHVIEKFRLVARLA
jgi:GNAT superfamily N-acetyltransferase